MIYYGILNVVVTHFLFYIGNQLEATILPGIRPHLFHKLISSSDFLKCICVLFIYLFCIYVLIGV